MNKTNSKIAIQSRQWFVKALLTLMQNNRYEEITITQLARQADLSRKTFYRLFNSKEDVLNEYMEQLTKDFSELISARMLFHYKEVAYLYFEFWYTNKEFLSQLVQNHLLYLLYQVTEEIAPSIFHVVKSNTPISNDQEFLSYAMSFSLGGLNNMLIRWCNNGMKKNPEELAEMLSLSLETAMM